ncbi:hypothetical protein P692DRAFT_20543853 [Suillus brevipes Sb2]|nr:hypothetical protein P692DRAFT_20543853 [Suillus brevipes Sb2]
MPLNDFNVVVIIHRSQSLAFAPCRWTRTPLSPVETPDRLPRDPGLRRTELTDPRERTDEAGDTLLDPGFCNPKVGIVPSSSAPSPTPRSPARTSECAGSRVSRQSRRKMLSAINLSSKTPGGGRRTYKESPRKACECATPTRVPESLFPHHRSGQSLSVVCL